MYTIDQAIEAIQQNTCWSDVCKSLDVTICAFNFKKLQRISRDNSVNTAHFVGHVNKGQHIAKHTEDTALVENSSVPRGSLRKVLIRLGLYKPFCEECNDPDVWKGKALTLEIDHINGVCTDNRINNLRWLCPNCHSQTATYRVGPV